MMPSKYTSSNSPLPPPPSPAPSSVARAMPDPDVSGAKSIGLVGGSATLPIGIQIKGWRRRRVFCSWVFQSTISLQLAK